MRPLSIGHNSTGRRHQPLPLWAARGGSAQCANCQAGQHSWAPWGADPVKRMYAETMPYGQGAPAKRRRARMAAELRAVAELIARHRGEFDDLVQGEQILDVLSRLG